MISPRQVVGALCRSGDYSRGGCGLKPLQRNGQVTYDEAIVGSDDEIVAMFDDSAETEEP
jgi:hypothetical protein